MSNHVIIILYRPEAIDACHISNMKVTQMDSKQTHGM